LVRKPVFQLQLILVDTEYQSKPVMRKGHGEAEYLGLLNILSNIKTKPACALLPLVRWTKVILIAPMRKKRAKH
jgi:hypothetical protein